MATNTPIEHIVLLSFTDENELAAAVKFIKSMQVNALKDGAPYVLSVKCGTTRPNAPVRSAGFNLAFVITFASDADREYFVKADPAHQELISFLAGKLAKDILVLDFADGIGTATNNGYC